MTTGGPMTDIERQVNEIVDKVILMKDHADILITAKRAARLALESCESDLSRLRSENEELKEENRLVTEQNRAMNEALRWRMGTEKPEKGEYIISLSVFTDVRIYDGEKWQLYGPKPVPDFWLPIPPLPEEVKP